MTNSTTPKGPARPETDAATEKLSDAMQQGVSAFMAVPQRLMQANLEAITAGMNYMNRRMKAQAAMWSGLGQLTNGSSLNDIQQHYIAAVTKEMAAEMQELNEMTRKGIGSMAGAFTSGADGFSTARSS